jgi:hypothetical protein
MGTNWVVPSKKELDQIIEDKNRIENVKIRFSSKLIEPMIGTVPRAAHKNRR